MNKYELVKRIEKFAPPELAESWDCSGWLIETSQPEIKKVMLCLTVTKNIINQAKEQNCDMIISHHPLFKINCHSALVSESLKPQIDIYCAHTNLDMAHGGTTDTLIRTLNLKLPECKPDVNENSFLRYVEFENSVSVEDFINLLKTVAKNFRYVNNRNVKELKKIAFCAGSGSEFIQEAFENGAKALVTGDIKFHTALESPIMLFDIGHFESEILVLDVFEKLLEGVEIVRADEHSPFIYS